MGYIETLNEALNLPAVIVLIFAAIMAISVIIRAVKNIKEDVEPGFLNIKARYKLLKERNKIIDTLPGQMEQLNKTFQETYKLVQEQQQIFMNSVNERCHLQNDDIKTIIHELKDICEENSRDIKQNSQEILDSRLDSIRTTCLNFVQGACSGDKVYTREYWSKVDKFFVEYEKLIEENNIVNGEMEVSHNMFKEKWQENLETNNFLDDRLGYSKTKDVK